MLSDPILWIGISLLVSSHGASIHQEDAPRRVRRSLKQINSMLEKLSGHSRYEFEDYGSFCGPGGSGEPLDSLDSCCQTHDLCDEEIKNTTCANLRENGIYFLRYDWEIENGAATCGENNPPCPADLCECDTGLVNCLSSNIDSYNNSYYTRHPFKPTIGP